MPGDSSARVTGKNPYGRVQDVAGWHIKSVPNAEPSAIETTACPRGMHRHDLQSYPDAQQR